MTHIPLLAHDPTFRQRASALDAALLAPVRPLEDLLTPLRRFGSARRREVRIARLTTANKAGAAKWQAHRNGLADAVSAFVAGVHALTEQAKALRPLINPALDDVLALAADDDHPLRLAIHDSGRSFGLSDDELEWAFGELARIDFRPVHLVCGDGFDDLMALLDSVTCGELGLLQAGFPRFTGVPETDRRVAQLVLRLRDAGVTASFLLAFIIVVTAHFVATQGPGHTPTHITE